jgi:DNA (cytosine-5)-methyltransferase 1
MSSKRKLYVVDLFAGCGGLSLGLENAGFEPIFGNELNEHARETYIINREKRYPLLRSKYHNNDVKQLVLEEGYLDGLINGFKLDYGIDAKKGELDLLVGGPPCQGFSGIGHRRSYSVEKQQIPSNHLYQDMAYVISRLKPKIFMFENVRGLLNAKWTNDGEKGEIWEDVQETFQSLPGYTVRSSLVYAKNYGVPQNRPRILLVGIRDDMGVKPRKGLVADGFLPEPVGGYPSLVDLWSDIVDPDYKPGGSTTRYPASPQSEIQRSFRMEPVSGKLLGKGAVLTEQDYSNHSEKIREKFLYMQANNGEIHESMKTKKFAQRLLPQQWGPEGPTITATSLPDDYVHYSQPRSLTVREWARLQMFPDWYQFAGKRTTGGLRRAGNPQQGVFDREVPKYTQIGNAVPVKLAEEVGKHFMRMLG